MSYSLHCLPACLPAYLPAYLPICLPAYLPVLLSCSTNPLTTGQIGWRVNGTILDISQKAYAKRLVFGDLPILEVPMPEKNDCIRIVPIRKYKTVYTFKKDKLRTDPEDDHEDDPELLPWDKEHSTATTLDLENNEKKVKIIPEIDPAIPRFDEKYYSELCKRTNLKNAGIFSMRCDLELKFHVAEKFKHDTFYYPYNLDFRGRAYPVPPNLNHLGEHISLNF